MKTRWILGCLAAVLLPWSVRGADPVFTLDAPDGKISGQPGQTVSWRFTLKNEANYLFVTSVAFVPDSSLGAFTDNISPLNLVVGPAPASSSVRAMCAFEIDPAAPFQSIVGQLVITYNLYSRSVNDPAFNPDTDLITQGASLAAEARVDIVSRPVGPLPLDRRLPCLHGACGPVTESAPERTP